MGQGAAGLFHAVLQLLTATHQTAAVTDAPPLVVELRRGPHIESRHQAHAVAVDTDGGVIRSWGTADRLTHARSAVKPLQALPLVETGAAAAYELGEVELALACASHSGEPGHVDAVDAWLTRIGCRDHDLECGIQEGRVATPSANNCSGKHAGFLTVARHLDVPTEGYIARDHPVQRLVTATLADVSGERIDPADVGIDGCGIPVHPLPLASIAAAGARFGAPPDRWPADRRDAARQLAAAMVAQPWYVAGTDRADTELLAAAGGDLLVKVGAQGVQLATIPAKGIGIAVKVEDGDKNASEVALGHAVAAVAPDLAERLEPVFAPRRVVTNHVGTRVGSRTVAGA